MTANRLILISQETLNVNQFFAEFYENQNKLLNSLIISQMLANANLLFLKKYGGN